MGQASKFPALDGLRGVAALAVVLKHAHILIDVPIMASAYMAVDFFFALSGFVLAHAYQERIVAGLPWRTFAAERAIRLMPMVVFGVLFGAVCSWWAGELPGSSIAIAVVAQMALIPAPGLVPPSESLWVLNPPEWSLFWEMLASLALAVLFAWWSDRRLRIVCLASLAGMLLIVMQFYSLDAGGAQVNWYGAAPRTFFSFTLGMLTWRAWRAGKLPLARYRPHMWIVALLLAGCLALPDRYGFVDLVVIVAIFPPLLAWSLHARVSSRLWGMLGRVSYPLYLCHYPLLALFRQVDATSFDTAQKLAWVMLYAVTSLILATALTLLYDEPVRAWLKHRIRWGRHRTAPVSAPSQVQITLP